METEKAIKFLKEFINDGYAFWKTLTPYERQTLEETIRIILKELEKKEKIIEQMAEKLSHNVYIDSQDTLCIFANKEEVKQYFENKVEEAE